MWLLNLLLWWWFYHYWIFLIFMNICMWNEHLFPYYEMFCMFWFSWKKDLWNANSGAHSTGMKLTIQFYRVLRSRIVELYLHSPSWLYFIVLNELSTRAALLSFVCVWSSKFVKAVTLTACNQEVPTLNLTWDTEYPKKCCSGFLSPSMLMLWHGFFLPNPFLFIIHQASYYSVLYSLCYCLHC